MMTDEIVIEFLCIREMPSVEGYVKCDLSVLMGVSVTSLPLSADPDNLNGTAGLSVKALFGLTKP
jgi:hypothetical protein